MSALGRLRRPATFYAIGLLNTGIDLALFFVLGRLAGLPYLLAQVVSYTAGATNSYILNRAVTFARSGRPGVGEPLRFAAVNALSLLVTAALLYLGHGVAHMDLAVPKAVATLVGSGLNYLGNRLWVFPDRQAAPWRAPHPMGEAS